MSEENVEVVRDQFAAVNERDFERAMQHYSEEVELVVPEGSFLEAGKFEGREAVGAWFGDWFRSFKPDYRFDIEESRDLGSAVFLVATHSGYGRRSGAEVRGRNAYLYRLRDGKIHHVELFGTREEALRAAGE